MAEPGATDLVRDRVGALIAALATAEGGASLLAGDVTLELMSTGEVTQGRAAVAALLAHLHHHAFAASLSVRTLLAERERALIEAEFTGVHVGRFAGIAPTQVAVREPYVLAVELADGMVVAIRAYVSLDRLVHQIRRGATPA